VIALDVPAVVATLASGALVGLLLAVFGGGGSVLAAPLLLYAVGVRDPHVAIGTSSAAVAANAAFNLVGHWRGGRVKWPCAITFALAGLAGAFAGSSLAKRLDGGHLLLAFAVAMAAIALSMMRTPRSAGDPGVHITPGLMLATGMAMANATASSLVSVAIFGASTSLNYAASGLVDWRLFGLLLAGGVVGRVAGHALVARRAFAAMVLAVAAYVAWRAIG